MVCAHLTRRPREIAQRFSARRRSARPSSRSPLPQRRPAHYPRHLARRRLASPTSSTRPHSVHKPQLVLAKLVPPRAPCARACSLAASARRRHVLAPPSTSLASLDRPSLGATSVAGEKIVLLLLPLLMQLHTTQLRPQRRRSRRSRQHAEAAEAAITRRSSTTTATTPVAAATTMTTATDRASHLTVTPI